MDSMVNITYVQTKFAETITNLEYSQIDHRFGNELQLLRSLSGRVSISIISREINSLETSILTSLATISLFFPCKECANES